MINPARALAALTGAAALTIAGMSPASAAYWTHNDAVGDVQTQSETYDEETGDVQDSDLTPAPDNTDTDVTGVSVNHRTHRVVLKTSLRDALSSACMSDTSQSISRSEPSSCASGRTRFSRASP